MSHKISFMNEENYKYLVYEVDETAEKNNISIYMPEYCEIVQLLSGFTEEKPSLKTEYDITDVTSLVDFIPKEAGRDDVFPLFQKILFVLKALRGNFITESSLLLQKEYVYVDNKTSMIKFAATPDVQGKENSVVHLLEDILETVNWRKDEKKTYLNSLASVLDKNDVNYDILIGTIKDIMSMPVEYLEPEESVAPVAPAPIAPSVAPVAPPIAPPVVPQAPVPPQPPVVTSNSQPSAGYPDFDNDDDDEIGATTVLGVSNQPMIFPCLIRVKYNEKVVVNKMEFLIGKDPSRVDYCIFDNSAVSRVHAKIICRNGEFFVVDNHSTNHVYVNGMMIDSNVEVRLTHGARVRLGDEDFEFRFQ